MEFEYLVMIMSIFLSFMISFLLFLIISFLMYSKENFEKSSSYECGFHPFDDTSREFNVRFYLVSILFIIFDLEIVFLFPWVLSLKFLNLNSFFMMIFFIIMLTIGFIYEWMKGALIWE